MKKLSFIAALLLWQTAIAQTQPEVKAGSVVVGQPTGGNEGPGTVNMTGCFINGVACAAGGGTPPSNTLVLGTSNTGAFQATQVNPGTILCNSSASVTQAPFTCTLGTNLSFSGTVLNATGGSGAVSSVSGTNGVTVSPTTGATVVSLSQTINAQTGTSYTVATTDAAALITFNNASAVAVTLPSATTTGFGVGFGFDVQNKGAGSVTITPTTSTINGASTLVITSTNGCSIVSDGTNYQVSACTAVSPGGSTTPSFTTLTVSSTVSGAGFTAYMASPPSIGTTAPGIGEFDQFILSGNLNCAGTLTNGCGMQTTGAPTYTDTSGTGGTINAAYMYVLPTPTFTASTATTYTKFDELFLPNPACSTNATCTTKYSLDAGGASLFEGVVTFIAGFNANSANSAINSNSGSATTNLGAGTTTGQVTIGGGSNTVKIGSTQIDSVSVVTASGNISVSGTAARHICVNLSTPAAIAVNLPAAAAGLIYSVDDCAGNAATYNLTVTPNSGNIDGSSTYVINTNYGSWSGYYTGTRWKTVSHQ